MTRFPCASLLSKRTVESCDDSSGGAILMASRRKFLTLPPNRNKASSAASSAFWRSLIRFAASTLSRDRTVSDCSVTSLDGLALDLVGVDCPSGAPSAGIAVLRDSDRVWLMRDSLRSVKPLVASSPTSASSF